VNAGAKSKLSLDTSPPAEIDARAAAYCADHFTIRAQDGTLVPLEWLEHSRSDSGDELVLYFQAALPDGVVGAKINDQVLMEQFPDQINSVRVRDLLRRVSLVFMKGRGEQMVQFPEVKEKD
jgi:hypothetical protein